MTGNATINLLTPDPVLLPDLYFIPDSLIAGFVFFCFSMAKRLDRK
jgi:hypothetical protein